MHYCTVITHGKYVQVYYVKRSCEWFITLAGNIRIAKQRTRNLLRHGAIILNVSLLFGYLRSSNLNNVGSDHCLYTDCLL